MVRGNLSGRDNQVLVGPDNNCQSCVPYSSVKGAQRRPISFGPTPGHHPHLESSPTPTTNLGYLPLVPSIPPISHTPPLRVPLGNGFPCLPYTCQPVHGRTAPHQAPALVGAPGQIQPLHPPLVEGYVMGSQQGCSLVRLGGAFGFGLGTSSSISPNFRMGHGHLGSPSEEPAKPFYLFLQSNGSCQGSPVGFPHFCKLGFS